MKKTEYIEQAGAVAFKPGALPEVLLVRARKDTAHWIFPKGHIEPGERPEEAAARELQEEAGVCGDVIKKAGETVYKMNGRRYHVVYYLMRYVTTPDSGEEGRNPGWYTVKEALKLLTFAESRKMLVSLKF